MLLKISLGIILMMLVIFLIDNLKSKRFEKSVLFSNVIAIVFVLYCLISNW